MLQPFQAAFLAKFVPHALVVCPPLHVPVSICVAQAAVESDWGRAASHFNYYGLLGRGDAGVQLWVTRDFTGKTEGGGYTSKVGRFAKFTGQAACIRAWCDLVTNGRYLGSLDFAARPDAFLAFLWASGYTAAPDHVERVLAVAHGIWASLPALPSILGDAACQEWFVEPLDVRYASQAPRGAFKVSLSPDVRELVAALNRAPTLADRFKARAAFSLLSKHPLAA